MVSNNVWKVNSVDIVKTYTLSKCVCFPLDAESRGTELDDEPTSITGYNADPAGYVTTSN